MLDDTDILMLGTVHEEKENEMKKKTGRFSVCMAKQNEDFSTERAKLANWVAALICYNTIGWPDTKRQASWGEKGLRCLKNRDGDPGSLMCLHVVSIFSFSGG